MDWCETNASVLHHSSKVVAKYCIFGEGGKKVHSFSIAGFYMSELGALPTPGSNISNLKCSGTHSRFLCHYLLTGFVGFLRDFEIIFNISLLLMVIVGLL